MSFFRKTFLSYLMLLLIVSSATAELCTHEHHGSDASTAKESIVQPACEGCDGEDHGNDHHEFCDSCVCACHGAGILISAQSGDRESARSATLISPDATRLPGHLRGLERPPLRS